MPSLKINITNNLFQQGMLVSEKLTEKIALFIWHTASSSLLHVNVCVSLR